MDGKAIVWMGSSKKDLLAMPDPVVQTFGYALGLAQNGLSYPDAKTLTQFKSAVVEVLEDHDTDTYRAVYTARFADTLYVLHCFKKKSSRQSELPKRDRETIEARLRDVTATEAGRKDKRSEDMSVAQTIPAGTSVLDDLKLDPGFVVKAKLAIRIQKTVGELGLNQRDAARRMGISQPRLSQLTRGKFEGLSQAKLEECLVALGHDVITNIGPRHDGIGVRRVEEMRRAA